MKEAASGILREGVSLLTQAIEMFECRIEPDGMRMVDPGGNSMTICRSQRMRWPPRIGLKFPRAVIAHQPKGRFPMSMWSKQHVVGPKLNVAHANTLLMKLRRRSGYVLKRGPRWPT